jgi:Glycosyl transferase family 2
MLAYLPYLSVGAQGALGFLPGYADEEGLRSGSRFFILNFLRRLFGAHSVPTAFYVGFALTVLALLAVWAVFRQGRGPRGYITSNVALGAAFTILLLPQYPWYFTWLVPFLCFAASLAWLPLFYLTTACIALYRLWLGDQPDQAFAVNAWLYLPTALLGAGVLWLRHSASSRGESTEASRSRQRDNRFEEAARDNPVLAEARVTVVIPALNEEAAIADVVRAVPPEIAAEVIVVDNGSDDRTAERARLAGARVVAEPQRGYGRACRAGVRALDPACSIVVFLDGDGSDCPELMNNLIRPIAQGDYDFVIGSRTRGGREKGSMNFQQIFAGRVAGWLLHLLYGARYTDMCPFRAIRRDALDGLGMREETYGWNLEMQMRAARAGLRILELPVESRCRAGGESKVSGSLRGTILAGTRIVATLIRVAAERD